MINHDFLISGSDWSTAIETLQFSFASETPAYLYFIPDFYNNYEVIGDDGTEFSGFSNSSAFDQKDTIRFFLIDPNDLDDFTGNDTVNTVLVNSAAYRTSFADVITAGFSEDSAGELQLVNHQGNTSETDSRAWLPDSTDEAGDIVINYLDSGYDDLAPGDAGFWLHIHELGHAIGGLNDVSDTSETGTYVDNQKYTMMSYNTYGGVYASSLGLLDVAALQDTYGTTNTATRSGNTTYSLGEGLGFYGASASDSFLYTIWDGGGTDTIDASDFDVAAEIDLREGHFSSIGRNASGFAWAIDASAPLDGSDPDPGNVAIAYGVTIENAIGTDYGDHLIGNDVGNTLQGGSGNDFLEGGAGSDILYGGVGNDTLDGGDDSDIYYYSLGEGNDIITENWGSSDQVVFGSGITYANTVISFSGDDMIFTFSDSGSITFQGYLSAGLSSTDQITFGDLQVVTWKSSASSGSLSGTSGTDVLVGGNGNNTISGLDGDDTIYGGDGDDLLLGHSITTISNDVEIMFGGAGNDQLQGGVGGYLDGGTGNDIISVAGGGATIYGRTGNDTIAVVGDGFVDAGDDDDSVTVYGSGTNSQDLSVLLGAGNDSVLTSGTASDGAYIAEGGLGNDTFSGTSTPTNAWSVTWSDVSGDEFYLFSKGDYIVSDFAGDDTYDFRQNGTGIQTDAIVSDTGGVDLLRILGSYAVQVVGIDLKIVRGDDILVIEDHFEESGTHAIEQVQLVALGPILDLNQEISDYFGDENINLYTAGSGGELVMGEGGDDSLSGGGGDDNLFGGSGNDTLQGGAGNDALHGGLGDDTLTGGDGNDTVFGGSGADTIIAGSGAGNDSYDGGEGIDTLVYTSTTLGIVVDLSASNDQAVGSEIDTDQIANVENVIGGSGSDTIGGDSGDNQIEGMDGDDVLSGGAGIDTVSYFHASAGVSIDISTTSAQNTVGTGTDTITGFENVIGSAYADTITGDTGSNRIEGGAGNDTLSGGGGDDVLVGGAGNDTIYGNGATDTVDYSGAASGVNVNLGTGTVSDDGDGGSDALSSIENVIGSAYADTIIGSTSVNVLYGGAGNDTIQGGSNNDLIYGDDGDDTLSGNANNDTLDGGSGSDTADYSAAGAAVTIRIDLGTVTGEGSDTLVSIENAIGSAYNDIVYGDGANNVLSGGNGNDTLRGNGGNDTIDGGSGTDTANYANAASAIVVNLSSGTASNDGDGGSDTISNIENVTGSDYNDQITGDSAANSLTGGNGDDVLAGRGGADALNGGNGTDAADYSGAAAGVTVNLSTGSASNDGDGSSDTLTAIENVYGSAYADSLTGNSSANLLRGGGGNDTLDGGSGTDTVDYSAAAGAVTVNLSTGSASNDGDGGSDTLSNLENIIGSSYGDSITGSSLGNAINAGAGNDTVYGGGSGDHLYGEAGDDDLYGEAGNDNLYGGAGDDDLDGGDGDDFANYTLAASGIVVDLSMGTTSDDGDGGEDTLTNIEDIQGSAFADDITGDSGDNLIYGNAGNDDLDGGSGADILHGGAGNDVIDGGAGADAVAYGSAAAGVVVNLTTGTASNDGDGGTDTLSNIENIYGSDYDDTLTGDSGANVIDGDQGNDILYGMDGNDTLDGGIGSGNDYLDGGAGDDTLDGGSGNDTFVYSSGLDTLYDTGGTDTLLITGGVTVNDISFSNVSTYDTKITITASVDEITIDNLRHGTSSYHIDRIAFDDGFETSLPDYASWMIGTSGNDSTTGNSSDNTIVGKAGNDTIDAGAGNDDVHGGADNDILNGGDGNDLLHGGTGDDTINGQDGLDTLFGGDGDDTFLFESASAFNNVDQIMDFDAGDDALDIADLLSGFTPGVDDITEWVQITDNGTNSTLYIDANGGADNFVAVAAILGVTGLTDEAALVSAGTLVVS